MRHEPETQSAPRLVERHGRKLAEHWKNCAEGHSGGVAWAGSSCLTAEWVVAGPRSTASTRRRRTEACSPLGWSGKAARKACEGRWEGEEKAGGRGGGGGGGAYHGS